MEIERSLTAPCPADELYAHVDDLDRYPRWMSLVHDVAAVEVQPGEEAAWEVELRAQLGPLARSKRLRMVRTVHEPPTAVVFERAELDRRDHAPWVLRVTVAPAAGSSTPASTLTMNLRYGGRLWTGAVLGRVLEDEIERGSERLLELVSDGPRR